MSKQGLAPHEVFELHELLSFKNTCATKVAAMYKMVGDPDLKTLMENDLRMSQKHIKHLEELLDDAISGRMSTTGTPSINMH